MNRILVPLDGSSLAELVLPYTIDLASRLGTAVTFLTVYPNETKDVVPLHQNYLEKVAERASEAIQNNQPEGTSKPVSVNIEFRTGYPAEEILDYAEKNEMDLVVMATHGYSGIRRWALGSVADKVLRQSSVPVLLCRAGAALKDDCTSLLATTCIILLDGSELAESVIPHVEEVTRNTPANAKIILLRVCEPAVMPQYYPPNIPAMPKDFINSASEGLKSAAAGYLSRIENTFKAKGFDVHSEVLSGDPSSAIIDFTAKHPCNLIAMSTHGRSGLSRWVYGSVAGRILSKASSPILLVRPKSEDPR